MKLVVLVISASDNVSVSGNELIFSPNSRVLLLLETESSTFTRLSILTEDDS